MMVWVYGMGLNVFYVYLFIGVVRGEICMCQVQG